MTCEELALSAWSQSGKFATEEMFASPHMNHYIWHFYLEEFIQWLSFPKYCFFMLEMCSKIEHTSRETHSEINLNHSVSSRAGVLHFLVFQNLMLTLVEVWFMELLCNFKDNKQSNKEHYILFMYLSE